jgi:hypothetical protein
MNDRELIAPGGRDVADIADPAKPRTGRNWVTDDR